MDERIQQGRNPEWRLAFESWLDDAVQARIRRAVENGGGVEDPDEAAVAAGFARREQRRVLLLGLVLLPFQTAIAVMWVRQFALGALPAVFGWFWVAVLLILVGMVPLVLRRRYQVARRAAEANEPENHWADGAKRSGTYPEPQLLGGTPAAGTPTRSRRTWR